ncbi:MAG: Wzt carbohydrate-binding domain-containing protein, partial [Limisphaerales bacterium]
GKMDEVAKAGRTILFVSHNMAAMQALCTKGFFLEKGRLKRIGPINDMINLYMGEAAADARDNQFCTDNRSGSGVALVTGMQLDCNGVKGAAVAGGRIALTVDYEAQKDNLPLQFIIGVYDSFNSRILAIDSKVVDNLPDTFPRKGKLEITFPEDSCLSPGRYYVNIGIRLHKEMVDFVQGAFSFVIEEGDFFKTGRLPYGKATVLFKNQWTLSPAN